MLSELFPNGPISFWSPLASASFTTGDLQCCRANSPPAGV